MFTTRIAVRSVRIGGSRVAVRRYATETASKPAASGALTGGLVGGGATLAIAYTWYHFSGAKTAVQTARSAKGYVDQAFNSVKIQLPDGEPSANEAIQALRDTANKYASFIPGGRAYVDSAFHDIEAIRKQHGDECDKIVREAYADLKDVSKKGLSLETAGATVTVLLNHLSRLSSLAGDAAKDILDEHPQLKEKLGGSVDQLRALSDRLGPEAKKQVDEAQDQIRTLVKGGWQKDTLDKVQKLIQEKSEKIREMSGKALDQGMDELRPMLEKNPQVKKFVDENMQAFKDGNATEVVGKVRNAIQTGNMGDLEQYISQAKQKGSGQLSSLFSAFPDGSHILSQFQSLQDLASDKGYEAQELVKETFEEIKKVLENKMKKADELRKSSKGRS